MFVLIFVGVSVKDQGFQEAVYNVLEKEICISRKRAQVLPRGLGDELSWMILLDFSIRYLRNQNFSMAEIYRVYKVRESVLVRIIDLFIENGLIRSVNLWAANNNGENDLLEMTEEGFYVVQRIINPG